MARPKKTNSEELVSILDSFFSQEAMGDPRKLKCSLLEEYARRIGQDIKAYDFRRDKQVRKRIDELKRLVQNENGIGIKNGYSYKSLDINKIMKNRQNPDELRHILCELDSYWQCIYEDTIHIRQETQRVNADKKELEHERDELLRENEKLRIQYSEAVSKSKSIIIENRYLKKMLRTYLYPALANKILVEEHQISNVDTEVTPQAEEELIDDRFPSSLETATSNDMNIITREEDLLRQMWNSIPEEIS